MLIGKHTSSPLAYIQQTHTHFNVTHELLLNIPCGDVFHKRGSNKRKLQLWVVIDTCSNTSDTHRFRVYTMKYKISLITPYSTCKCLNCSSVASVHGNSYTCSSCSIKRSILEAWELLYKSATTQTLADNSSSYDSQQYIKIPFTHLFHCNLHMNDRNKLCLACTV